MTERPNADSVRDSGEFGAEMKRLTHRCSNLEGFVWTLWRAGVVRIEGENVLVNGVDVPGQFSEVVREALAEFQQDYEALFSPASVSGSSPTQIDGSGTPEAECLRCRVSPCYCDTIVDDPEAES